MNIDDDWENFLCNDNDGYYNDENEEFNTQIDDEESYKNKLLDIKKENNIKCTDIYISTTTKIAFLNKEVDIYNIFWDIPIIDYDTPMNGIIKKQIKLTTFSKEDSENVKIRLQKEKFYKTHDISLLDNPKSKAKVNYKHVQKISIGINKKDFINYRTKEKGAFYNCFALVFRILFKGEYKEVHVKVFNTGKLEIPGIQHIELLYITLDNLITILQKYYNHDKEPLRYIKDSIDTVLINSNFSCGYYINREKLYEILKFKYNLISMYDPCSYPGIQSKFYYNKDKKIQNGICSCKTKCNKKGTGTGKGQCYEVSFMIFRTGSILIVGRCDEIVLNDIYLFLKNILEDEFTNIFECLKVKEDKKQTKRKTKKLQIIVDV